MANKENVFDLSSFFEEEVDAEHVVEYRFSNGRQFYKAKA
jgi:hypothetical protein